ncbi:hypothetical protein AALO_G00092930 [Alosa alosa]|uniref:Transposase Helix-turn-helix domain-containing protein n=1 Tax=Alosa alosa TaxID=278164 RepID=A0AAV6GW26_9TELE|nr:uncharacterized protein LOC125297734 [Alosa alosa]KAG5277925.1 hypothetical protein AALO_G00092930 [Alosa alosa]
MRTSSKMLVSAAPTLYQARCHWTLVVLILCHLCLHTQNKARTQVQRWTGTHRKRRREDGPSAAANQRAPSETPEPPEQECSMDHCPAEEDIPVPRREYDDLNLKYCQLQEDYVNLRQELETLRAENVKLKEDLHKSTFSYTTVKCNITQLLFLTGLTSVVFEWLITKIMGSVERIHNKLTVEDHLLIILMKLRLGLCNTDLAYRFQVSKTTISNIFMELGPCYGLHPQATH